MGQPLELHLPDGRVWRGTLVPPHELSGARVVQLKLDTGYNVGIRVDPGTRIQLLRPAASAGPANEDPVPGTGGPGSPLRPDPGHVALLTTGGTIASRVDYRTGGVRPVQGEREILEFYPELESEGPVRIVPVLDRLSEEMTPADWELLAHRVAGTFAEGARGIVIAHGTDTLGFTAAGLAFLLEDLQGPVVLVGAQRSPDRPSSDGVSNLTAAVRIARTSDLGEVVVVMHDGLSDDRFAVHRGTRVRKMHSSRRDAFESRNSPPIGKLDGHRLDLSGSYRVRTAGPTKVPTPLDPRGAVVWFHPGLDPERVHRSIDGLRGVILAGTGLGHVSSAHLPWIRDAVRRGVVVAMTTQCLAGEADPFVYATGRELLRSGVLYLHDLLPEVAYAKLLWALGRTSDAGEVARLLSNDRAGEFEFRHGSEGL
jgi:glutamyl-tRNA(Gln) amidotransferase subunit D